MKKIKYNIGLIMGRIGVRLWERGGWTGDESYEDLTMTGKLGYHLLRIGMFTFMGLTVEELESIIYESKEAC